jgi:phosphohistidine swiveling domain-containing protein
MTNVFEGSKARNLQSLKDAGFNVPAFYIVSSSSKEILSKPSHQRELKNSFRQWTKKHEVRSVAVRSSSTQEDTQDSSFAGQFTTVLDVHTSDEYVQALTKVLTSRQSDSYSKKKGSVNAIVQEFIEPDCSGVIFSANPANGNNEIVINTARGRGDAVVDGDESEQYFVNRLTFLSHSKRSEGRNRDVLSKTQIRELCERTIEIETLFGSPQDIEWAIKGGVVYVLQARPITRISHLRLWDSSNISESFPGIVSPLTFSIAKKGYLLGYKAQAYAGGLSWYELEANHRNFDSMIGIFNGRMYYNLLSWYRYISLFPGSKKNQKFLDDQIATEGQSIYQAPPRISNLYKVRYFLRLAYRVIFFNHELKDFYKKFAAFELEHSRLASSGGSQLLMARYEHIEQTIIPHFGRTLDNDFLVMSYHGWLKRLLNKWIPEGEMDNTTIIGSLDGVMSAKQALSLYDIALVLKNNKIAYRHLVDKDYPALEESILGSELHDSIQDYVEVFGHRFAEDQKIESINPTLENHGIYRLLEVYTKLDSDSIAKRLNGALAASQETESRIKKKLRIHQRIMYVLLLKRLKEHLKLREKNRLLRGKVYGYMRELFPKVGAALVRENVIDRSDDVFYLEIEEIYQLLQGSLIVNDLKDRVRQRRRAYKSFSSMEMPERFITTALPSLEKIQSASTFTFDKHVTSISGLISSPGTIEGKVVVLREPKIPNEPYDILVASHTDPGWTPLIALAKGVVVEHGGMLSHAAIVTRELGIPSIIGVPEATKKLKTGMIVRINTQNSSVDIIRPV